MSDLINRCTFDVCLLDKSAPRKTLAGVPVMEAVVAFDAPQTEHHEPRQAQFEIAVIALGDVATGLEKANVGQYYRIQGFLNRKSLKSVKLRLHLTHINSISISADV